MDVEATPEEIDEKKIWHSKVAHTPLFQADAEIDNNTFKQMRLFSVNVEDNEASKPMQPLVRFCESQHNSLNDKIGAVSEALEKQLRYGRDEQGRQYIHLFATFSTNGYAEHSWPDNFAAGKSEMVFVRAQETGMFDCFT